MKCLVESFWVFFSRICKKVIRFSKIRSASLFLPFIQHNSFSKSCGRSFSLKYLCLGFSRSKLPLLTFPSVQFQACYVWHLWFFYSTHLCYGSQTQRSLAGPDLCCSFYSSEVGLCCIALIFFLRTTKNTVYLPLTSDKSKGVCCTLYISRQVQKIVTISHSIL